MSSRWLAYQGPQVPKYLRDAIKMRAGVTPFGEPRYRLVLSRYRYEQAGGVWTEWDESLSASERNRYDRQGNELNRPLREVEEMRWVPKYPPEHQGWVLEKWLPPQAFGHPSDWPYKLLGAYPHEGDYEDTGFCFPSSALTEGIVLNAIGRLEQYFDKLPSTKEGRVKRAKYISQQNDSRKEAAIESRNSAIVGDSGFAFSGRPFMSMAGEKRKSDKHATADRLGISHSNID